MSKYEEALEKYNNTIEIALDLNTPNGRIAKKLIDEDNYELGLLGYGTIEDNKVLSCNIAALSVTGRKR